MNKKVGFIIPSLKSGGAERVLSTISLNLDQNMKQYIFTWDSQNKDYDFKGDIVEISTKNSSNLVKNIIVLFKRVKEMKKYKEKYKIDSCISHLEGPNIVNILSKRNENTVITVHNFQSKERIGFYGFIFKVLIKLLYNKADKIITVSNEIKIDLVEKFNIDENKVEVIYNPFDYKLIKSLSKESIEDEYKEIFNNQVVINIGRLTESKGQWNLIKSFYELKKTNPTCKLIILGKGELEQDLKKLTKKLKLENDVFFLGFHKNPFKFIANADVFALTSRHEGFPMCLAEAMICGTPIVSVDCKSGPREMLCSNNEKISRYDLSEYGIITECFLEKYLITDISIRREEKIFCEALDVILSNEDIANEYTLKGKARAYDFDVSKIMKKWKNVI